MANPVNSLKRPLSLPNENQTPSSPDNSLVDFEQAQFLPSRTHARLDREVTLSEDQTNPASRNIFRGVMSGAEPLLTDTNAIKKQLQQKIGQLGENHEEVAKIYHHLATVYQTEGYWSLAKGALNESIRIYLLSHQPDSQIVVKIDLQLATINYKLGKSLYDNYKYEQCIQPFYESLIVEHPDCEACELYLAEAHYLVGANHFRKNKLDEAIDHLGKSIQIKNIDSKRLRVSLLVEALVLKGKSLLESDLQLAIRIFNSSLKIALDHKELLANKTDDWINEVILILYEYGAKDYKNQAYGKSLDSFKAIMNLKEIVYENRGARRGDLITYIGNSSFNAGLCHREEQQPQEAIAAFKEALDAWDKTNTSASLLTHLYLADTYLGENDVENSFFHKEKLVRLFSKYFLDENTLDFTRKYFSKMGRALFEGNRFDECIQFCTDALNLNYPNLDVCIPYLALSHYELGVGLFREESFEEAARHLIESSRHFDFSSTDSQDKKLDCLDLLLKILERGKHLLTDDQINNFLRDIGTYYFILGLCQAGAGLHLFTIVSLTKALALLKKVNDSDPKISTIYEYLATAYISVGDSSNALLCIKTFQSLAGNSIDAIHFLYGKYHLNGGIRLLSEKKFPEAITELNKGKAIFLKRGDQTYVQASDGRLADTYYRWGLSIIDSAPARAVKLFEKALPFFNNGYQILSNEARACRAALLDALIRLHANTITTEYTAPTA